MSSITAQILPYAGSKASLARWLVGLMPRSKFFLDVFGGTGSIFMQRQPIGIEIYNDISADLHNVFSVIRDRNQCDELVRRILATPDGRQQHDECRTMMNDPNPVVRAWAYLVVANCGHPGCPPRKRTWYVVQRMRLWKLPLNLAEWSDRMQRVKLECKDWLALLPNYDREDVLLFADPPYLHSARKSDDLYGDEMSDAEHVVLLHYLRTTKARVILCGYRNRLYDRLLSGWRRLERPVRCRVGKNDPRIECVWVNYDLPTDQPMLVKAK